MEMLDEMRKLLHEKKACFLQYEEETSRIALQEYREAEEFEAGIAARQRLIEEIDGIDDIENTGTGARRAGRDGTGKGSSAGENQKEQHKYKIYRILKTDGPGSEGYAL